MTYHNHNEKIINTNTTASTTTTTSDTKSIIMSQQPQYHSYVAIPEEKSPLIVVVGADHFQQKKRNSCCNPRVKAVLIFLLAVFCIRSLFFSHIIIGNINMDEQWTTDYEYPSEGLNPELEFERPIQCRPNEASVHVYTDPLTVPIDAELLRYEVKGIACGIVKAIVDPTLTTPEIKIQTHFHLSNPNHHTSINPSYTNQNYTLTIETPRRIETNDCVIVSTLISFPVGFPADKAQALLVKLIPDNGMSIQVDLEGLQGGLKGLVASTASGYVKADNLKVKEEVVLAGASAVITASNINADRILAKTASGPVKASSITANTGDFKSTSGVVSLTDITIASTISAKLTSGAVFISGLSGTFTELTALSTSGLVKISNTILDDSHPVQISAASTSGACNIELTNFYGKFKLSSLSGFTTLRGTELTVERQSWNSKSGYRGHGSHLYHVLDVKTVSGMISTELLSFCKSPSVHQGSVTITTTNNQLQAR
ncbi:hypothetical protein HDU76_005985 [Blyttiomyces sp. JEL0837]|nr:hypothetical protein HDU76_005985 [Blyttiomyces sp. JEL0837]